MGTNAHQNTVIGTAYGSASTNVNGNADGAVLLQFNALSEALEAQLVSFGDASVCGFSSVSIDSRTAESGALFAALSGSVSDGHSFVESAFKNGAVAALVDCQKMESFNLSGIAKALGKTLIAVNDTAQGLQGAARIYLEQFPRLVKVAVTGSAGKTTTKEIAAAIIGTEKNTAVNPGNYNSASGLPLAVFNVRSCHEVGIFEMGMDHQGEIASLAKIVKPGIAAITNIGSAHIGTIGSQEAIALEKKKIFSQMDENGIALIPEGSDFRNLLAEGVRGKVVFYGEKSFAEFGGAKMMGLDGSEIVWEGKRIRFALPGKHNLANAFTAIAIARELGISAAGIRQGLESVKPLFGRGEIIRGSGHPDGLPAVTVIQDCYNANPESMAQALEFCASLEWPGRRIYIIGDMLELGNNSREAHESLGRLLADSKADMIFLFGRETRATAEVLASLRPADGRSMDEKLFHTDDIERLSRSVCAYVRDGDLALLKGSRGCALERVLPVIVQAPSLHIAHTLQTGGTDVS